MAISIVVIGDDFIRICARAGAPNVVAKPLTVKHMIGVSS